MIKLKDLNKTEEISFDNIQYTLSEKDWGTTEVNLSTSQGYLQVGETIQGRTIGTRNISLVGYCLATTEAEMLQRKRKLQRIASLNKDFLIIVDDTYQLQVAATSSIEFATSYTENNKFICKFMIEASAAFPFFIEVEETKKEMTNTFTTIKNEGDCAVGMKIELFMKDKLNPPKNPYIKNYDTGEKIAITYTFELFYTDSVVFTTHYGNKTAQIKDMNSSDIMMEDAMELVSTDSEFFTLPQGITRIKIGAEENVESLGAFITYTNCFLGV